MAPDGEKYRDAPPRDPAAEPTEPGFGLGVECFAQRPVRAAEGEALHEFCQGLCPLIRSGARDTPGHCERLLLVPAPWGTDVHIVRQAHFEK